MSLREANLEKWDGYENYLEAIDNVICYQGEKRMRTVKHTVDANGKHTEEDVWIVHPDYQNVLDERKFWCDEKNRYLEYLVNMESAKKSESSWLKILLAVLYGAANLGGIAFSIYGQNWFEKHDSFDKGNVLTDSQKSTLREMQRMR